MLGVVVLFIFDALAVIVAAMFVERRELKSAIPILLLTFLINYMYFRYRKKVPSFATPERHRRYMSLLGYIFVILALSQTLIFSEGVTWIRICDVLIPLTIGVILLRYARKIKPAQLQ